MRMGVAAMMIMASFASTAEDCEAPLTQADMNMCALQRYEKVDRELEETYASILAESDPTRAALLNSSQEAWKTFRATSCAVHGDRTRVWGHATHGTAAGSLHGACMHDVTLHRITELKEIGVMQKLVNEGSPR